MTPQAMNRRRFLHLTGGSAAGAAMMAAGVGLTATSPGAWALALTNLDAHQGKTLLKVRAMSSRTTPSTTSTTRESSSRSTARRPPVPMSRRRSPTA